MIWKSLQHVRMFVKLCFYHNSVNSQPISLIVESVCSYKIDLSIATDGPVYNRLQPVFYRVLLIHNLRATATATDQDSGQPDQKSGLYRSIFWSSPVQLPVHMTGLSNTSCNQTQPVLQRFSNNFIWRQLATQLTSKWGNHNRRFGCFQLCSVRFRFCFRSYGLDLQTLKRIQFIVLCRSNLKNLSRT
jgi:hypothetical protein